jgi:hypothetical protein
MNLEFKIFKIKENSDYARILKQYNSKNEFIKIGEMNDGDKTYCKMLQLDENGITLFGGLKPDEISLGIPKEDLQLTGDGVGADYIALDIPKEYLTMELIEDIQKLNSMEG